jgi:DNA-binding protein Fis
VLHETIKEAIARERDALYDEVIEAVDRALIGLVLEEFKGNQTKSARLLGASRTTLLKKIKNLGLDANP